MEDRGKRRGPEKAGDAGDARLRLVWAAAGLAAMGACAWISMAMETGAPMLNTIGIFPSVLLIMAVTWRFPVRFYVYLLLFDILAAGLGSVVNLYDSISWFDKAVHLVSGIVAAEAGRVILMKALASDSRTGRAAWLPRVTALFSAAFSGFVAGFWEIYEFTMDQLINTDMQRGSADTMGDIIAGTAGGILYGLILYFAGRKSAKR